MVMVVVMVTPPVSVLPQSTMPTQAPLRSQSHPYGT